jgi:hypothetical protein
MSVKLNRTDTIYDREARNKENENWATIENEFNNVVDVVKDKAYGEVVDAAKLNWKEPVASVNDLPTTASEGDTMMARDTGKVYRYNGTEFKEIQQIDAGPVNEVDSRLTSQLAQKANDFDVRKKSELIGLNDADGELLAAIQNKEGETVFNLESIPRDRSVSPTKTTFMKPSRNLFDGNYQDGAMALGGGKLRYVKAIEGYNGKVAVVPIKPNQTYSIKVHEPEKSNVFRVAVTNSLPIFEASYKDTDRTIINNDTVKQVTFTNDGNGQYVIVYVANDGKEPKMQIEEGDKPTAFTEPYLVGEEFLALPETRANMENLLFAERSQKNLFDGNYSEGVLVYSTGRLRYARAVSGYQGRVAVIPIKPNQTYSIKVHEPEKSNVFRVAVNNSLPVFESGYKDTDTLILNNDSAKQVTFTNTDLGQYVIVYVSNNGQEPKLQIEEGDKSTAFENYIIIPAQYVQHTGSSEVHNDNHLGIFFNKPLTEDFVRPSLEPITTTEGGFDLQNTDTNFIYGKYDDLMEANPDYISKRLLGYAGTAERTEDLTRPIYEYYFKPKRPDNVDIQNPLLLVDSGMHGYEKQAVWATYTFFEHVCNNYETDDVSAFMRYNIDFRVIPVCSPYSYDNNQRWTASGVDPNTNFETGWYATNHAPNEGTYPGEKPMTELETLLVDAWFNEFKDDAFAYVNMHNTQGVNETSEGKVGICWIISPTKEVRTLETSIISDYSRKWWKEFPKLQTVPYNTMFGFINERVAGTARNQAYNKYGIKSVTLDTDRNLSQVFPGTIFNGYEGYAINVDVIGATIVGFVRNFAK